MSTLRSLLAALAAAVFALPAAAQDDRTSARSVVQVRCTLPEGEMKATGFVWPQPGYVVTALHAVAGCEEIVVYSEAMRRPTLASAPVRALLEADLALLALDDDLGLAPVSFAPTPKDTRGDFFAWGYPHAAEEMIDLPVQFGGGLKAGLTTIGQAFASDKLNELFRSQPYPGRDTTILRVTSTIQPGHSGAPIFDAAGAVVAVANGGLLGGWRTVNWSIPAAVYLPNLLDSSDRAPSQPSAWAGLYSATVSDKAASISVPHAGPSADAASDLKLVRQIDLAMFVDRLLIQAEEGDENARWLAEDLLTRVFEFVDDPSQMREIVFDIYEDRFTGATVAVPSWLEPAWDPALEMITAINGSGAVELVVVLSRTEDFDTAVDAAEGVFLEAMDSLATWYDVAPLDTDFSYYSPDLEVAVQYDFFYGEDALDGRYAELYFGLNVMGNVYLGTGVYIVGEYDELTAQDYFDQLMLEIAAEELTDFAVN